MGRYTYFENGKWRIKVGDTEFAGPWVDKLSYYEELAPNLENTKDEAYNLGYQTCLHAKGLTWSEARELQAYRATGLTVERAAELEQVKRERDAAVKCLCTSCKKIALKENMITCCGMCHWHGAKVGV